SWKVGSRLLAPLLALGIGSVLYWSWKNDLRFYGLVQFYPMVALPFVLLFFQPTYTRSADWFLMLGWYVLAKLFEHFDAPIFSLGRIVSAHSLKHVAAALALYWLVRSVRLRKRASVPAAEAP